MNTDPLDYGWWLASRAAGITAYALLSLAILAGLAMAMRLVAPRSRARVVKLHERLGLLGLGMIVLHGLLLLGDSWLKPTLVDVLVPFSLTQHAPLFTGLGTLAFYVAALLSLSFYARKRLGARRWRTAHRWIPVAWILASVHAIGSGSDAGSLWLQVPLYGTIGALLVMLAMRWRRGTRPAGRTPRPRTRVAA